jgi:hypothetical protein
VTPPLLALTVRQPFALALAARAKPVENRDGAGLAAWARRLVGQRIALHASKKVPADLHELVARLVRGGHWPSPGMSLDALVAFCHLSAGNVVAVGTLDRVIEHGDGDPLNSSPWRTEDRFGLVFTDVVQPEILVPAKGALGFWRVPVDVAASVADAFRGGRGLQ